MEEANTKGSKARNMLAFALRQQLNYRSFWRKASEKYAKDKDDVSLEINYMESWAEYIAIATQAERLRKILFDGEIC